MLNTIIPLRAIRIKNDIVCAYEISESEDQKMYLFIKCANPDHEPLFLQFISGLEGIEFDRTGYLNIDLDNPLLI